MSLYMTNLTYLDTVPVEIIHRNGSLKWSD